MVMNAYENHEIISMVTKQTIPNDFLLDYLFPAGNTVVTDADKLVLSNYTEAQAGMAPYTDPCGPGVALKIPDASAMLSEFAPPTIKLKDSVVPCDAEDYRINHKTGEFVASHANRMEAGVARVARNMRASVIERLRHTAGQIAQNGAYTIEGDEVDTTLLDFKRDPKLTLDLVATGGDVWSSATSEPTDLFEAFTEVMTCYGIGGTFDIVFSPLAWKWYKKHVELARRDFNYSTSMDPMPNTMVSSFGYVQPKGTDGEFNYWVLNQQYKDDTGTMQPLLPDGSILMVQRQAFAGRRVYGGIRRANGEVIRSPLWFRDLYDAECDVRKLQAHSRPMLIPGNVNATAWAQVVDPSVALTDLCPVC